MIDVHELKRQIIILQGNKCTIAPWHSSLLTVHEEPPRSLNPGWKENPHTWYPLCNDCHEKIQYMNRDEAVKLLKKSREAYYPWMGEGIEKLWQTSQAAA